MSGGGSGVSQGADVGIGDTMCAVEMMDVPAVPALAGSFTMAGGGKEKGWCQARAADGFVITSVKVSSKEVARRTWPVQSTSHNLGTIHHGGPSRGLTLHSPRTNAFHFGALRLT